jgi:ribosomal protein S16
VLGTDTNRYIKLANLYFNRESSAFWYECGDTDMDVDTEKYCHQAENLFALYQNCYGRNPVETIVDNFIVEMDAVKISVHGKLFFVPRHKMGMVDILEDFIGELNANNLNSGTQMSANSIFVINDEKQRGKMEEEFYTTVRKELEMYQERLQHFIQTGAQSRAVIDRWLDKISSLKAKKQKYEELFKKELNLLNDDFDVINLQSQELQIRLNKMGRGEAWK